MFMRSSLLLFCAVSLLSIQTFAQPANEKKPLAPMTEPSKEQRAKMAEMHAQAAECLKSDKSFEECHKQMMENCPMARDGSCPMMGSRMMHHKGMMKPVEKQKTKEN